MKGKARVYNSWWACLYKKDAHEFRVVMSQTEEEAKDRITRWVKSGTDKAGFTMGPSDRVIRA